MLIRYVYIIYKHNHNDKILNETKTVFLFILTVGGATGHIYLYYVQLNPGRYNQPWVHKINTNTKNIFPQADHKGPGSHG